jgi:S-adenosylmethionine:tRNA ribosyltransferase-isomerase
MDLRLSDFDYDLPARFIAQTPADKRDHSKLLTYDRACGSTQIRHFYDILDYLKKGDVLVVNSTRVIPARVFCIKPSTGAKLELLLLKKTGVDTYRTLVKPLKRLKFGESVEIGSKLTGVLLSKDADLGTAEMRFESKEKGALVDALLDEAGTVPLPHYITKKLAKSDEERYQTVYAKTRGSIAAPTAGLHFTPELIERAKQKGVVFCEVVLHVGLGTFRPVKCDKVADHHMHSEYYEIPPETVREVSLAKAKGRRVVCVGTTSLRTLEGSALHKAIGDIHKGKGTGNDKFERLTGSTDIFIYPPYNFKIADALITNFHLPKSTLLMLVSSFLSPGGYSGIKTALELYEVAKQNDFRFFSFGDCMFIA